MNHPATRDPLGSRSPGCCYHHSPWNPHFCPPCRICQRPVLSLQPCILRHPVLFSHPPSIVGREPQEHLPPDRHPCLDHHHSAERYRECRREHRQECHAYEPPRRQRSFEAPRRRDVDITDGRSASYPHYHTHPPPGSSSAGYTLSKSPSVRLGSPGGSLGQRSPGARVPKSSGLPDQPHRWIGEETKRALPLHVYKYYLAHTKEYHRQNIKVSETIL
ncbi:hypothetical protein DMN91_000301 [Ooceraea biroi]|uniref:Uncharacterized protein n=1 Tax=Ooceraea biroi TaxID=2015173 RepID=A0A3L8E280_OOCBI|nr:hypothetical protein DMN91_000301 [Ooceraea biroi]